MLFKDLVGAVNTPGVFAADSVGFKGCAGIVATDGPPEELRITLHALPENKSTPAGITHGIVHRFCGDIVFLQPEVVDLKQAVRLSMIADRVGVKVRFDLGDGAKEIRIDPVPAGSRLDSNFDCLIGRHGNRTSVKENSNE